MGVKVEPVDNDSGGQDMGAIGSSKVRYATSNCSSVVVTVPKAVMGDLGWSMGGMVIMEAKEGGVLVVREVKGVSET